MYHTSKPAWPRRPLGYLARALNSECHVIDLRPLLNTWLNEKGSAVSRNLKRWQRIMAESSDSVTPSPSPQGSAASSYISETTPPGRPKRSPVWKYFAYRKESNQSICQVEVFRDHGDEAGPSSEVCLLPVAGKYPTNLKQHLRKSHPTQYREILLTEKEEQQKKEMPSKQARASRQLTVAESLKGRACYDRKASDT